MIVLGVDPGSHATGYGVINTEPALRMLTGGVVRTGRDTDLPQRLRSIHAGISAIVAEFQPDTVAVENVFNARNARASLILGHARGVVLLAGAEADRNVAEYSPREIKLALTGNGAAAKEQVRFMVMRLLGLREQPPLDQSDALAVALTHASRARMAGTLSTRAGG